MTQQERDIARRGGALGVVLGVLVVVILVGFFLGWFDFGFSSDEAAEGENGDRVQLEFGINKDEISDDTSEFFAKVRDWTDGDNAERLEGTLVTIDPAAKVMSVRTGDAQEISFGLADDVEVEGEDETDVNVSQLAQGQPVEVTYLEDEQTGKKVAVKVKIERRG